jgi:hypothetical protein
MREYRHCRRYVSLPDQVGAVRSEHIDRATVHRHHRAADVANPLPLGLEPQAGGNDVPLVETQSLGRDAAEVSLDYEESHAVPAPRA